MRYLLWSIPFTLYIIQEADKKSDTESRQEVFIDQKTKDEIQSGQKPPIAPEANVKTKIKQEIKTDQNTNDGRIPSTTSQNNNRSNFSFERLSQRNISENLLARMEAYIKQADMTGVSYYAVANKMNWDMLTTRQYILSDNNIVEIKDKLYHKDAFIDWNDGSSQLEEILAKLMRNNDGYVSSTQLYEYARAEMNLFLNDNDLNEERSVYDMTQHLFEKEGFHGKHYRFTSKMHISRVEEGITSNLDLIKKYAADQGGVFAFDDLVSYLEKLDVPTGNLRFQMKIPAKPIFFYYTEGVLMYAECMHIGSEWKEELKNKLSALLSETDGHIILRHLPQIWLDQLPELPGRRRWTPLLVQSVLRCYGKELGARTISAAAGQSLDTLHTMLVTTDCPIQSFGDAVIAYLIENEISQRVYEARGLQRVLVNAGLIQGAELINTMPKALNNDARFAWDASGTHVRIEV